MLCRVVARFEVSLCNSGWHWWSEGAKHVRDSIDPRKNVSSGTASARSEPRDEVELVKRCPEDTEGDRTRTKSINLFLLERIPSKQSVSDSYRLGEGRSDWQIDIGCLAWSPSWHGELSQNPRRGEIHQVRALRLSLRLRVASFVDVSRFQLRNRLAVGTKSAQSSRRCQIRRQMLGSISGDLGIVRWCQGPRQFPLFICSNNQSEGRPGQPRLVTCGLVRRKEPYIRETL
jgi:hypothetical protein